MIFVIAGTEAQAYDWINKEIQEQITMGDGINRIEDYTYVHSSNVLAGTINPHGIFIGNWYDRKDISDILQTLLTRTNIDSPSFKILQNVWKNWQGGSYGRK